MSNYIEKIEINLDKIRSNYDLIRRGLTTKLLKNLSNLKTITADKNIWSNSDAKIFFKK